MTTRRASAISAHSTACRTDDSVPMVPAPTVSGAADALHVTTSAVSQQVAKLERETGQKLLERNGRGVRLTDAAELLVRHAERILALVEEAQSDLEAHRGTAVGELSVAAFPTAIRGLMAAALI